MLRIAFASLLASGLVAAALACGPEQPAAPATEVPAPTASGVTQVQGQDSATAAAPATDVPALADPTAAPSAPTAQAATVQPTSPTPQAETPAAPTDAATASPAATAEPTAAAGTLPTATAESPPPTHTLPPPTDAPTAAPTATAPHPSAREGTSVGETPPAFAMSLTDGTQLASADLAATGRPVFMHYFATW